MRHYGRLLPESSTRSTRSSSSFKLCCPRGMSLPPHKKKKGRVATSCQRFHEKKIKCNQARPVCDQCLRTQHARGSLVRCHYVQPASSASSAATKPSGTGVLGSVISDHYLNAAAVPIGCLVLSPNLASTRPMYSSYKNGVNVFRLDSQSFKPESEQNEKDKNEKEKLQQGFSNAYMYSINDKDTLNYNHETCDSKSELSLLNIDYSDILNYDETHPFSFYIKKNIPILTKKNKGKMSMAGLFSWENLVSCDLYYMYLKENLKYLKKFLIKNQDVILDSKPEKISKLDKKKLKIKLFSILNDNDNDNDHDYDYDNDNFKKKIDQKEEFNEIFFKLIEVKKKQNHLKINFYDIYDSLNDSKINDNDYDCENKYKDIDIDIGIDFKKIEEKLPKLKEIQLLLDYFLEELYYFLPYIEKKQLQDIIKNFSLNNQLSLSSLGKLGKINRRNKLDKFDKLLDLMILIIIIMISYLNMQLNQNSRINEIKVNNAVIDIVYLILNKFQIINLISVKLIQLLLYIRSFFFMSREDGNGGDQSESNIIMSIIIRMSYLLGMNRDEVSCNTIEMRKIWYIIYNLDIEHCINYGSILLIDDISFNTKMPRYISEQGRDMNEEKYYEFLKRQIEFKEKDLMPFLKKISNIKENFCIDEINKEFGEYKEKFKENEKFQEIDNCCNYQFESFEEKLYLIEYVQIKGFNYHVNYKIFLHYEEKLLYYLKYKVKEELKENCDSIEDKSKFDEEVKKLIEINFQEFKNCLVDSLKIRDLFNHFFGDYDNADNDRNKEEAYCVLIPIFFGIIKNALNFQISVGIRVLLITDRVSRSDSHNSTMEEVKNKLEEIMKEVLKVVRGFLKVIKNGIFKDYYSGIRISMGYSIMLKMLSNSNVGEKGIRHILGTKFDNFLDTRALLETGREKELVKEYDVAVKRVLPQMPWLELLVLDLLPERVVHVYREHAPGTHSTHAQHTQHNPRAHEPTLEQLRQQFLYNNIESVSVDDETALLAALTCMF
ncbi:oleate-activated transcription factor OAF1 ASCRUDRAFT_76869 [Ascoidea rubescens DSM 1968]|uniref:Xylanolytic transcriptional activator regulatory domain-containing protein n=1 Tax=Ascoidea rubescens DSM 1968 TaxID=1344418 RepID=A0A1D2VEK2_9ASCO|nr:hypothetical protein ASCRUDRAFT_76869 [Ascoidea rubescens DSM 1968]ODV59950.1 hypothetical protein ASCRUDRAFT_76869 [Ascoidea rubescens DSM 1968]